MSVCTQLEPIASTAEQRANKYALKLLGLDFGNLPDEEILEFISHYVQPSAIKALFYDSYNSFYVLHLSDIESTAILIGKTLQIETNHVTFLPLFDCFVIGNVYLSLSNNQLRDIFSLFGNVFEVANNHVLPNSSKFFHVLSGTREISFLIPGHDSEVQIPVTVMHPPYTFHVKHLCLGCLTQGHSLMNCPDKAELDASLPKVSKSYSAKGNDEKNVVVNIMREMTFEVLKEKISDEKPEENNPSNVTTIKEEVLEENGELMMLKDKSPDVEKRKEKGTKSKEMDKKSKDIGNKSKELGNKRKEMGKKSKEMGKKQRLTAIKKRKKLKRNLLGRKKKNSSSDTSESDFEHTVNSDIPPFVKSCIMKSEGIIPTNVLLQLLYIDARNRGNILAYIFQFTSNVRAVLAQLRQLQTEFVNRERHLNAVEFKFRQKVWTIIKVLMEFQEN